VSHTIQQLRRLWALRQENVLSIVLLVGLLAFGLFTPVFAQFVCVLDGGNFEPTHPDLSASSVEEMLIMSDPSDWVNSTVLLEGIIDPLVMSTGNSVPPWDYALSSNGYTIGVSWQGTFYNGEYVTVLGVVTAGHWEENEMNGTVASGPLVYFIEAESIELL
jgi:hypothetical protein